MAKIKTNDEVIVITGKDKGKRGKVLKVADERVTVAGINLVKKHVGEFVLENFSIRRSREITKLFSRFDIGKNDAINDLLE